MNIGFVGDVVGEPGRNALYQAAPELREEFGLDALVANGENAAGGRGITPAIAQEFLNHGIDAITLGDHAWDQSDLIPWLPTAPQVLRPFNLQQDTPGQGSVLLDTPAGKLGIICLMGRTFMRPGPENPFPAAQQEAERLKREGADSILVEIHAEATSEKIALGMSLDGRVSAVLGTHTHVPTADARILPGGTACMTDVGMCGSRDGILGRRAEDVIRAGLTGLPCKLPVGGYPARLHGVVITTDSEGHATRIQPISRDYDR